VSYSDGPASFDLPALPNGWQYQVVSELGAAGEQAVLTGPFGTNLGRDDFIASGVPLLTIGCLTDSGINLDKALFVSEAKAAELERYRLKEGDLLFSRMASVGRAGLVTKALQGALFNYHIMRLRLDRRKIEARVFINYVRGAPQVRNYLKAVNHGATREGINTEQLLGLPVAVPPRHEQCSIVAEIEKQFSRLDEAVASLKRVQANLHRYKSSVLQAAVRGRLVEAEAALAYREHRSYESGEQLLLRILEARRGEWAGKRKYREPVRPETESTPRLPSGWAWASPEQLSAAEPYSLAIGPFGSSLKVGDYKEAGVPLVFVRNIRSGSFGGESTVYVTAEKARALSAHTVRAGDILVTKMGDPPGDVCRYPLSMPPAVITADCIKLRLPGEGVDPAYIEFAIASGVVQAQIMAITKGVAQLKVNLANFSSIALPLPPLAEQRRIAEEVDRRLSIVRELEAEVDANLKRAQSLRHAVLAREFSS
jgi:type I restriction enzyme, S subunit